MLKIENILKGILMTLLGCAIMFTAAYFWFFTERLTGVEAITAGIVGFALCFMRTKLDDLISKYVNNLIDKKNP